MEFGIYSRAGCGYALRPMSPLLDYVGTHSSREFAPGGIVIEQGEWTGELLVLLSGEVEILRDNCLSP